MRVESFRDGDGTMVLPGSVPGVREPGPPSRWRGPASKLRLHPSYSSGRSAARPFFRDDRAAGEDLAAPDPVGFMSCDRAGQADPAHRAGLAICLGEL